MQASSLPESKMPDLECPVDLVKYELNQGIAYVRCGHIAGSSYKSLEECPVCRKSNVPSNTIPVFFTGYYDIPRMKEDMEALQTRLKAAEAENAELRCKIAEAGTPEKERKRENEIEIESRTNRATTALALQSKAIAQELADQVRSLHALVDWRKKVEFKIAQSYETLAKHLKGFQRVQIEFSVLYAEYKLNNYAAEDELKEAQNALVAADSKTIEAQAEKSLRAAQQIEQLSKEYTAKNKKYSDSYQKLKEQPVLKKTVDRIKRLNSANKKIKKLIPNVCKQIESLSKRAIEIHAKAHAASQLQSTSVISTLLGKINTKPKLVKISEPEKKEIKEIKSIALSDAEQQALNAQLITALYNSENHDLKLITELIERGAKPDDAKGKRNLPVLLEFFIQIHYCNTKFEAHRIAIAKLLIIHSPKSINCTNHQGDTALHWAAYLMQPELVQLLCEHNADATLQNTSKRTPLEETVSKWGNTYKQIEEILNKRTAAIEAARQSVGVRR